VILIELSYEREKVEEMVNRNRKRLEELKKNDE